MEKNSLIKQNHNNWVTFGAAILAAPFFLMVAYQAGWVGLLWPHTTTPQVWFWGLIGYPVCEEIIFRGVLQRELLRFSLLSSSWRGISLANLSTSLIFASAHIAWFESAVHVVVFFPSLVIGHIYERAGGLPGAIILHSWYNFAAFWWFWNP